MVQAPAVKLMKMFSWFAGAFSICMCFLKLQRVELSRPPYISTLTRGCSEVSDVMKHPLDGDTRRRVRVNYSEHQKDVNQQSVLLSETPHHDEN